MRNAPSTPSVDVFVADDVVLAQIAAGLHLDQHHRHLAGVLHPVHRAQRDIDRLVFADQLDTLSSTVTLAVPSTTIQCSDRWWWLCRLSAAPGCTTMRLT